MKITAIFVKIWRFFFILYEIKIHINSHIYRTCNLTKNHFIYNKEIPKMRIEYKKKAVKYINSCDKEDKPEPDELEAIAEAKADTSPSVPHEAINWD